MNMFRSPYRAADFGPPGSARRQCKKCGDHSGVGPRYNKARDLLEYRCHTCGYEWTGPPADRADKDIARKLRYDQDHEVHRE